MVTDLKELNLSSSEKTLEINTLGFNKNKTRTAMEDLCLYRTDLCMVATTKVIQKKQINSSFCHTANSADLLIASLQDFKDEKSVQTKTKELANENG